jgi:hypothetical protein
MPAIMSRCYRLSDPLIKRVVGLSNVIVAQSLFDRYNGEIDFMESMSDDDIKSLIKTISHSDSHTMPLNFIKESLKNQLKKLNRSTAKDSAFRQNQVERLLNKLKGVDAVMEVAEVVDYLYDDFIGKSEDSSDGWVAKFDNLLVDIEDKMKTLDTLSPSDRTSTLANLMKSLQTYFDYVATLDHINLYEDLYKSTLASGVKPSENSTLDKIQKLSIQRENIKNKYANNVLPVMAKILLPYANDNTNEGVLRRYDAEIKRLEARKAKGENVDKAEAKAKALLQEHYVTEETLLARLQEVNSDLSYIDKSYSPMISLGDFTLGLFAKFVKKGFYDAKNDLADFKFELQGEYKDFINKVGHRNSPHLANKGLFEVVVSYRRNDDGVLEELRHNSLVKDWDESAYNKKLKQTIEEIDKLDDEDKGEAWRDFYSEYHEPISLNDSKEFGRVVYGIRSIITKKKEELAKGIITKSEFDEWVYSNMSSRDAWIASVDKDKDPDTGEYLSNEVDKKIYSKYILSQFESDAKGSITFKGELSRPKKSKFKSSAWEALQSNSTLKEYHKSLTTKYFASQSRLPKDKQLGYVLPYRYKTEKEFIAEGKTKLAAKNFIKDIVKVRKDEVVYGDSEGKNLVPIYYTNYIPAEESSVNLFESILNFEKMSRMYEASSEMEPISNAFKSIIKDRSVNKTNSRGEKFIDNFAKKYGMESYVKQNKISNAYDMVDLFIEQQIYGQMSAEETIDIPGVGTVDIGHLISRLMGVASMTMLGGPEILKSTANWLQAAVQKTIEGVAGEYVNTSDLGYGEKTFIGHMKNILNDFAQPMSTSLQGQWLDMVDFMQGSFMDEYGNNVSGSAAMKLATSGTYMFMNHAAEFQTQASFAFALGNTVKLLHNGKEVNLIDAYEKGADGRIKLKDGVTKLDGSEWTKDDMFEFTGRLHAINKRLHGVYNSFDRAVAKKWSIHKLLLMFKGFLIPTVKRRYKKFGGDHELGGTTEGFYRTFTRLAFKEHKDLINHLMRRENNLTPEEKANVRRAIAEFALIGTLMFAASILSSLGEDDEELANSWSYQFALYEMVRLNSELKFYLPVAGGQDQLRLFTSPSAMNSFAERLWKASISQPFGWSAKDGWSINDTYKRKEGVHEKGDSKMLSRWAVLLGYNGNNILPSQAMEAFQRM